MTALLPLWITHVSMAFAINRAFHLNLKIKEKQPVALDSAEAVEKELASTLMAHMRERRFMLLAELISLKG